jgi:hypothetical protein
MIHHLVLIKLKAGIPRDDPRVRDGLAALVALREQIPGIVRWEHGWNFTQRPVACDFALDCTFSTREAFDAYGPHPAHQSVVAQLREVADWVLCDFES